MFHRRLRHGTATARPYSSRPGNATFHCATAGARADSGRAALDPHAREPKLARLEAVRFRDEHSCAPPRGCRGLADAAEARQLIDRLKELYDASATAFQIEELAGGYQPCRARAIIHGWLA